MYYHYIAPKWLQNYTNFLIYQTICKKTCIFIQKEQIFFSRTVKMGKCAPDGLTGEAGRDKIGKKVQCPSCQSEVSVSPHRTS